MDWSLTDAAIYGLNRHCCQTTGRKHGCSSRRQIPSQSSRRFDIPQLQHDSNSNRSHQIFFITITITIIIIIIIIWECCYSPTLTVLDGHEFANGILYALWNSSVFRCQWKDMTDSCWFRTAAAWQSVPSRWCCNSKATRTLADSPGWWNDEVVTNGWVQTGTAWVLRDRLTYGYQISWFETVQTVEHEHTQLAVYTLSNWQPMTSLWQSWQLANMSATDVTILNWLLSPAIS